ncbi:fructose-bisphosphate aldolase-like [Nilaparvata lugens]|uniref:fructose-bisphosphate aldolase-like n=1 Tax=Nilaparvata lugens TaxID=108931 RepID=UPI00193E78B7|nr:fructose-bisphosphate aldolase-like [Nilaparvata lugens]
MRNYSKFPSQDIQDELETIAKSLLTPGKGILASDESVASIGKHFAKINVENNEENRLRYRHLLYSADPSISEYISGVILFHDTVYQKSECVPLIQLLKDRNIIPGIKVDKGLVPLFGTDGEFSTQGLDKLAERCEEYKQYGLHFAKWRCALKIGATTPSQQAIADVANILARYAVVCQASRLVPIVEPEVLADGKHDLCRAQKVLEVVNAAVFEALNRHGVFLEGCLLKTNMATPGRDFPRKATPEQVACATVTALLRTVPPALAGIVFLSGGQSEEEATVNLNAINKVQGRTPWTMTFSYGRALQASVLDAWKGNDNNIACAQQILLKRAMANGLASVGQYQSDSTIIDGQMSGKALFVEDHNY